jgi:hypothetical protein
MFAGNTAFDQDISGWNMSRATFLSDMFHGATNFAHDISTWNIANVADMESMLEDTPSFPFRNICFTQFNRSASVCRAFCESPGNFDSTCVSNLQECQAKRCDGLCGRCVPYKGEPWNFTTGGLIMAIVLPVVAVLLLGCYCWFCCLNGNVCRKNNTSPMQAYE